MPAAGPIIDAAFAAAATEERARAAAREAAEVHYSGELRMCPIAFRVFSRASLSLACPAYVD